MKKDPSGAVQSETRRLAAIMFTDIVGFSRQMGADEARTLHLLEVHNRLVHQAVDDHHGQVIKTIGDAFLVDFPSVVHAVQCAQQIHAQFRTRNAGKGQSEEIHVRIGIHLGDLVQKDGDVFGDGVKCVEGTVLRFGSQIAGQDGNPPNEVAATAGTVAAGNTRYYQLHYRNPSAGFCPPEAFNVTNGAIVVW